MAHEASETPQATNRPKRIGRIMTVALTAAILATLLFAPWRAFFATVTPYAPPPRSGPFETRIADIETALVVEASTDDSEAPAPIELRLIFPSIAAGEPPREGWPLILYIPDPSGDAANEPMLLNLASYGYVVATFEPPEAAPPAPESEGGDFFAFWADLAYASSDRERRAQRSERIAAVVSRALEVLDSLLVSAHPDAPEPFAAPVDMDSIAAIGHREGAAAAIVLASADPRLSAVVSLDAAPVAAPSAHGGFPLLSVETGSQPFLTPSWLQWLSPAPEDRVQDALLRAASPADATRGYHRVAIWGARPGDLSDQLHRKDRWLEWRPWLPPLAPAPQVWTISEAYMVAFLRTYLNGQSQPLLTLTPSPFPEARL